MKFWRSSRWTRYALAVLGGALLAAAFPHMNIAGLAWIAPALLLAAAHGLGGRDQFRVGWIGGLAFYLCTLYWLLHIPVRGFPILGWIALSCYMALYQATWVWLTWKLFPSLTGETGARAEPLGLADAFGNTGWAQRFAWAFLSAAMWVALEMIAARLFSGFPWTILGVSQHRLIPLIQIASVTGVYGLSFLAVWMALSLLNAGILLLRNPTMRCVWLAEMIVPLLAAGIVTGWGWKRIQRAPATDSTITAALIQPSIPQTMIWDKKEDATRFNRLIELSTQALTNRADILIWPEAALPALDAASFATITNLIRTHRVWMIFGADDVERRDATIKEEYDYYNSAWLFDPEGRYATTYRKQQLVIFGEYIPLIRWLPFVKYLTPIEDGFTSGDRPVTFHLRDLQLKLSVLICFEDVFPHLARRYVTDDLDFLLNLTNDGWFGESAEQWQHAAIAAFRAVENGVPLVRCTNNGLTCWFDECGRMREHFATSDRGIYGEGFLIARLPKLAEGEMRTPTFYRRHGDWFGWICVTLTVAALGRRWLLRRRAT